MVLEGEGGGGIAIALGNLARGVLLNDGRVFDGVVEIGIPIPIPIGFVAPRALGVPKGDPVRLRVGEARGRGVCKGDPYPVDLVGLSEPAPRLGLAVDPASCLAVMPTYLAAREPGVMLVGTLAVRAGVVRFRGAATGGRGRADGACRLGVLLRGRAEGVTRPLPSDGVIRPFPREGVTRPFPIDGVTRPLAIEGVTRPFDIEGVLRPPYIEATEDGRDMGSPAVGADSFVEATKTPQLGGQLKYCLL